MKGLANFNYVFSQLLTSGSKLKPKFLQLIPAAPSDAIIVVDYNVSWILEMAVLADYF